jgi:hypothetical protein
VVKSAYLLLPLEVNGMESLNLAAGPPGTPSPTSLSTSAPKSPGVAFFLSLLVPGLGQFYCGEKRRALWTFFFFALGFGMVIGFAGSTMEEGTNFLGIGLRTSLVLYVFSFLDAYFTAREMTDGTSTLLSYNPRVAAVLNLLTHGFGYWYLDEKRKGVILFVLVGIADRAASASHATSVTGPLSILVEIVLAVMAVDAYRIANRMNEKNLASITRAPAPLQPAAALKPALPVVLASLLALGYLGLVVIGILMPEEQDIDQTQAVIRKLDSGTIYANGKYKVEVRVPRGWTVEKGEEKQFVSATNLDGGCSLIVTRSVGIPFVTARLLPAELLKELQKGQPGYKLIATKTSHIGNRIGQDIVYSVLFNNVEVTQTYAYVQSGFWIDMMIITMAEPLRSRCEPDLKTMRDQAALP